MTLLCSKLGLPLDVVIVIKLSVWVELCYQPLIAIGLLNLGIDMEKRSWFEVIKRSGPVDGRRPRRAVGRVSRASL